jgi:hypothetical protein
MREPLARVVVVNCTDDDAFQAGGKMRSGAFAENGLIM